MADHHNPHFRMSDDELLAAENAMQLKAWNSPRSTEGSMSDAHARFGAEWGRLHTEVKRRGLTPKPMARDLPKSDEI